jgi:hypothetical protein
MVAYVVVVKEKSPEKFRAVGLTTGVDEAKQFAKDAVKTQDLESYVFEIGRTMFRFDDKGNELEV